jgi:hypothetical protein
MTGTTISGIHLASVTLISGTWPNPVTVASHATISTSGTGLVGQVGTYWTIDNFGTIEGSGEVGTGIYLEGSNHSGGSVFNEAGGTISGSNHGINLGFGTFAGVGTISNDGTILGGDTGSHPAAIYLSGGGYVTNLSGGVISAASTGILGVAAFPDTVANQGLITAASNGVYIDTGGSVTNQSGGLIQAGSNGIELLVATGSTYTGSVANLSGGTILAGSYGIYVYGGTATNQGYISASSAGLRLAAGSTGTNETGGTITAASGNGVELYGGGSFTNQSGATISAEDGVRVNQGAGTVVNQGAISASNDGIVLAEGGYATNEVGGIVSGSVTGVVALGGAATLLNAGTIAGSGPSGYALTLATGFTDRLIIDPGAVFVGTVSGGNTIGASYTSTLELASGATIGTLTGLGARYIDFAQIVVDPGASWVLAGNNTLASGVTLTESGTLTVTGSLTNSGELGGPVTLAAGGYLYNGSGGTIVGGGLAAVQGAAGVTVVNAGLIDPATYGVDLPGGGSVTNVNGGTIVGTAAGVKISGAAGTVSNAGSIYATSANSTGVELISGGTLANLLGGTIDGTLYGVQSSNAATVTNSGQIGVSAAVGIGLSSGQVTNAGTATITGTSSGVRIYDGGTVVDAGTISGGTDAVYFHAGFTNRLVVDPGAVFSGALEGGNTLGAAATSTLELASSTSAGTLSALGSKYVDFGNVTIDAGAAWTLTGSNTLAAGATLTNAGTLTLSGATLSEAGALVNNGGIVLDPSTMVVGSLIGSGSVTIDAGATLDVTGAISSGETIVFGGSGGYLDLGSPGSVAGSVTGFVFGDTIDLKGIAPGSVGYSGGELQINGSNAFPLTMANGSTLQVGTSSDGTALTATPPPAIGDLETVGPINLGTFYQGDVASTALSIMNAATAGSAGLDVTATASGEVTATGSITALAPGATDSSDINAAIDTSSPGVQTGYVTLTYASDDGQGNIVNAGSAEIEVIGTVYGPAEASLSAATIYVHQGAGGGLAVVPITISNTALSNGYAENLDAQLFAFGPYVTGASGSVVDLKPGQSNDTRISATLSDANIGSYSGVVGIHLQSDGTGIDNHGTTSLGDLFVQATVNVDQYAVAAVEEISGDGTVTPTGVASDYVLALGTVALNGTPLSANIGVLNDVVGTADLLGGSFAISGDAAFDNAGFGAFGIGTTTAGLAAQQVDSAPIIELTTGTPGAFSETITFNPIDYNPDYSGPLTAETLTVTGTVLCFLKGTRIATPAGEVPVERLAVGDMVVTTRGTARPIVWIGSGALLATRGRRNAATPVIVRKGALAANVPTRDLRVTKGHALYLDGALIPVEFLVNHRSIEWDDRAQEVKLFHIELETHDVLIANGAPAESYRDDGNRWLFRNANSGWSLPPQEPCAPVLTGGPVVDAVWSRLLKRAGPRPGLLLTEDPDLHLLVDGARLEVASRLGAYIFRLPSRPSSVRIVSRAGAPAELGLARDPRILGVAVQRIALRQGTRYRVMEAGDALLSEGFHAFEQDNGLRWTDGDACVPTALFDGFDGAVELALHVGCTTQYPLFGKAEAHRSVG